MNAPNLPPDLAAALDALGTGRLDEARQHAENAVTARPEDPDALHISGLILFRTGEADEAIDRLVRALEARPEDADILANLGQMQFERGEYEAALDCLSVAAELAPGDPVLALRLAMTLQRLGQVDEAITIYDGLLKQDPGYVPALYDRGHALQTKGDLAGAIASFDVAAQIMPVEFSARSSAAHLRQVLCRWDGIDRLRSDLIDPALRAAAALDGDQGRPPLPLDVLALPVPVTPREIRTLISAHARTHGFAAMPQFQFPAAEAGRKLRIGYVSSDFRDHPVGHLLIDLLPQHDTKSFDIVAYSLTRADGSPERSRFVTRLPRFSDLSDGDEAEAARRIREDNIDILVDLNGHTRDNRLRLFARRPAPLQASWLGFAATTGADFIDYIVADKIVAPAADRNAYAEQVVQLPDAYIAVAPHAASTPPSRPALGLPEKGLVFCAFGASYKIEPVVFGIWMRLLQKATGSVLWLRLDDEDAFKRLQQEAQARGVDPARLINAPRVTRAEHLDRQRAADLFLDTLFYGGHATVANALSVGLPVVSAAGGNFASRVGVSLLRAAGMADLATDSPEAYEKLALRLAGDEAALADAKARLAASHKTAALFDPARFMRHLEAAYRRMWDLRVAGKPPEPISPA